MAIFSAYNPSMKYYYNIFVLPDRLHIATTKILTGDEDGIDVDRFEPACEVLQADYGNILTIEGK